MKRFTIIFSILLILGFAGAIAFVAASPDFVDPSSLVIDKGEDPDVPIWKMSLDEVLSALEDQGLIDRSTEGALSTSGLCSDAYKVSGAEFYWWDLENLDQSGAEFTAYKSMKEEGYIDLFGMGSVISPMDNGPFGLLLTYYEGDPDALMNAFQALRRE